MRLIQEYFGNSKEKSRKNPFSNQRLTTARAIYQSLTELASNQGSDVFRAYYAQIAEKSGKSPSTVKAYCREFVKMKILARKCKRKGKTNLANQWRLLTPSVNNSCPTLDKDNNQTSVNNNYQLKKEKELEKDNENKGVLSQEEMRKQMARLRKALIEKKIIRDIPPYSANEK